jgi:CheY-like chemotaxis protein
MPRLGQNGRHVQRAAPAHRRSRRRSTADNDDNALLIGDVSGPLVIARRMGSWMFSKIASSATSQWKWRASDHDSLAGGGRRAANLTGPADQPSRPAVRRGHRWHRPGSPRRSDRGSATEAHPDLVILDLGLPDMDGVEVIRSLRKWTQMPIVILSGRMNSAAKVDALDAGADDYVQALQRGRAPGTNSCSDPTYHRARTGRTCPARTVNR